MSKSVAVQGALDPAGAGALIYAVYWVAGVVVISLATYPIAQCFGQPSIGYIVISILQMLMTVGWLLFVVYRATKGGRFTFDGTTFRFRTFLRWKVQRVTGPPELAAFISRSEGMTYVSGSALVFPTEDGSGISVATLGKSRADELGVTSLETQLIAPTLVVRPEAFEDLLRQRDEA